MKLFKILSALMAVFAGFAAVRKVLDKYQVGLYYYDKQEAAELAEAELDAMDLRGTPTHECICGSKVFNLPVAFEDYEIATYFLEMQCVECGSIYTAPTPLDREDGMRKSERLRLLEMQVVRLEMLVELYTLSIDNLLESQNMKPTELDAGKWYQKRLDNLK